MCKKVMCKYLILCHCTNLINYGSLEWFSRRGTYTGCIRESRHQNVGQPQPPRIPSHTRTEGQIQHIGGRLQGTGGGGSRGAGSPRPVVQYGPGKINKIRHIHNYFQYTQSNKDSFLALCGGGAAVHHVLRDVLPSGRGTRFIGTPPPAAEARQPHGNAVHHVHRKLGAHVAPPAT